LARIFAAKRFLRPDAINGIRRRCEAEAHSRFDRASVKFELLTKRGRFIPTTERFQSALAPKTTARLRELPREPEHFCIPRPIDLARASLTILLEPDRAENDVGFHNRSLGELARDFFRKEKVIRVKELNPFAGRDAERFVARGIAAAVRPANQTELRSERFENLDRTVGLNRRRPQ
jgi:hypothetical protein